ncbi:regulatory protein RecX [Nocardia aurantiaca]|uniref:Regulatory protein RecX n=1 Tax=Nocardia aurantiaca TaxID=2675850 RepID=A0A6I3KRY3_9NOCA|nr:hypothetical protein [Nocardia aurantiaca]
MLARRGYNSGTAYAVVTAELAASAVLDTTEQRPDRREQTGESPGPSATRRAGFAPRREPVPIDDSGDDDSADASEPSSFDDEQARAAELVRAKLRTLPRDLDREKAIRRLVGVLARRGFSQSLAYTVVKAELADAGPGGD